MPVDTLGNMCRSEIIDKIDVLKIDTEEFKPEVPLGAKSILPKHY